MITYERRLLILKEFEEKNTVSVTELAERCHVTPMTIRRDLALFEKQGLVSTNYGGAALLNSTVLESTFSIRSNQQVEIKERIGKAAASFIQDYDTLFIDTGTTVLQILKYIENKHLTIITTSWPVTGYVGHNPKIKLILAPGEYREDMSGVDGAMTAEFIRKFRVNKAFLGALACSPEYGITAVESGESTIKRLMWENAEESFLLVDDSKVGSHFMMKYNEISDFSHIICNTELDAALQKKLQEKSQDLILA